MMRSRANATGRHYLRLAKHYRDRVLTHGDTAAGMDWPSARDNQRRFDVMLDLFADTIRRGKRKPRVLDFACGASHFYEFLRERRLERSIVYTGIDIVDESISLSRAKYPMNKYLTIDVLADPAPLPAADFAVINGLFTQKRGMTDAQMKAFLSAILKRVFPAVRSALAFNTMSAQVDYKRRGAFHVDLDWMARFLSRHVSRNFIVRHDYGLFESTFYVYRAS
jgi:SAM-dependent methyltransferase